jgi:hypothetical protein
MNRTEFEADIIEMASQLKSEYDLADALDHVHETVDGLENVIYYFQAWEFVHMIRNENFSLYMAAQDMFEDMCSEFVHMDQTMCLMAYCIYATALNNYLYQG